MRRTEVRVGDELYLDRTTTWRTQLADYLEAV